jgi:hypothetical protein
MTTCSLTQRAYDGLTDDMRNALDASPALAARFAQFAAEAARGPRREGRLTRWWYQTLDGPEIRSDAMFRHAQYELSLEQVSA